MEYWESGMALKLGDDIYDSFRAFQGKLLREYHSLADEFGFRAIDARRQIDAIQDELRRQIDVFLTASDSPVSLVADHRQRQVVSAPTPLRACEQISRS